MGGIVEYGPYWKKPYLPAADVETVVTVVTSYYDVGEIEIVATIIGNGGSRYVSSVID